GAGGPYLVYAINNSSLTSPLQWCNRDPRCKKLQLTDLLVAPVQHIMKVPLILRDIEGRTEDPQERAVVREIIEAEEHSLSK
ncbi:prolactin receptor, partial [Halocaridina rubra]